MAVRRTGLDYGRSGRSAPVRLTSWSTRLTPRCSAMIFRSSWAGLAGHIECSRPFLGPGSGYGRRTAPLVLPTRRSDDPPNSELEYSPTQPNKPASRGATMSGLVIIWTKVDEAPARATFSLLPIVEAFAGTASVTMKLKDISLTGR